MDSFTNKHQHNQLLKSKIGTGLLSFARVLKQALKGSGPNHMVDMSLCALFLLDASKRVDQQLKVQVKSSHYTTRDADTDITKMASYLVEEKAEREVATRTETTFEDPI